MVKMKVTKKAYYCVQDFVNDIELMWSNAINYYTPSKEQLGSSRTSVLRSRRHSTQSR